MPKRFASLAEPPAPPVGKGPPPPPPLGEPPEPPIPHLRIEGLKLRAHKLGSRGGGLKFRDFLPHGKHSPAGIASRSPVAQTQAARKTARLAAEETAAHQPQKPGPVAEAAGAVTERAVKTARLRNTPQQASPQAAPKTAPIVEDADAMGAAPAAEAAASEAAPQPEPQRGGKTQPRGPRRPGGLMGDVPPPLSKKEEKRQHQDQADYFWAQTKIAENVNLSDAARDEARRSAERTRQVVFGGGKVPRERKPRAPRKAKANEPSYASEIPDETGRMLSPDEARAELDMLQQQHAAAAPQRAEPTPRRELSPDAKPRGLGLLIGAMRHRERGDKEASARMLGDFGRTPYAQRERLEQQLEKAEGTAEKLREPARRRKGFRRPTPEEIEEQARHAAAIGEVKGEGTPTRGTPAPVAPTKLTPEEELALLERVANDPHIMPLRRKRAREDAEKMRKQLTKKQRRSKQ